MVDRLSPIDQRLKPPPPVRQTAKKPKDPDASASGRAIGDNGSTNMVDRLSPIDQRPKPPPPVRPTAKKPKAPAACASGRAIGDNGSTMLEHAAACASADS